MSERRASSPRLPRSGPEVHSNPSREFGSYDPEAIARATYETYAATGHKRLARRLGYRDPSILYGHGEMVSPDQLDIDETPRTRQRNPADTVVRAVLNAQREGAPEEKAAAVLHEICRQCGYERPEQTADTTIECLLSAVGRQMAAVGQIAVEMDAALEDGDLDRDEKRSLLDRLDGMINHARGVRANIAAGLEQEVLDDLRSGSPLRSVVAQ